MKRLIALVLFAASFAFSQDSTAQRPMIVLPLEIITQNITAMETSINKKSGEISKITSAMESEKGELTMLYKLRAFYYQQKAYADSVNSATPAAVPATKSKKK